ncbi:hypothetical protein AX16_001878 [Volvariella volvacea WC 439]|nr:hypothetical protein AX16_001878 [Volvariella volvacea WC 439]
MTTPMLPSSGEYLKSIYRSAKTARESHNILVSNESIHRLLYSPAFIATFKHVTAVRGIALPLKFSSHLEELNFLSIWALLDFGSSYRVPLHMATGRGSSDNIRALMFALYLSSATGEDLLSAKGLQNISAAKIAELLGVSLHAEKPHSAIPGVTVGQLGGPIYEFVKSLAGVLQDTGETLVNSGYPNLGAFVLEALKEGSKAQKNDPDAVVEVVLERLAKALLSFQDLIVADGQSIYIFKKALQLVHSISIRFGSLDPSPFPVPSTKSLPVISDSTLPSMLVYLGVMDTTSTDLPSLNNAFKSADSAERLAELLSAPEAVSTSPADLSLPPRDGPHLPVVSSYVLRAAAIDTCQLIADYARTLEPGVTDADGNSLDWIREITPFEIGHWLVNIAKYRKGYRELGRFVAEDTVYF